MDKPIGSEENLGDRNSGKDPQRRANEPDPQGVLLSQGLEQETPLTDEDEALALRNSRSPYAEIKALEDVMVQIRENLFGPQQAELVQLLETGLQMLNKEWSSLSQGARQQASSLQSTLKSDPYTGIVTALRLGFAIRQVFVSRRSELEPGRNSLSDREDLH